MASIEAFTAKLMSLCIDCPQLPPNFNSGISRRRCSLNPWPPIKAPSRPLTLANTPHYLSPHSLSFHSYFSLAFSLFSPTLPTKPSMRTRAKNASSHPVASIMTPAQLAAVGIPQPKCPPKKPSKDQQIAALEEDLCMARELLQMVATSHPLYIVTMALLPT